MSGAGRGGEPTWADGAALTQRDILVLTHDLGAQDAGTIFVTRCLLARHRPRGTGAGGAVVGGEGFTIRVYPTLKITLRTALHHHAIIIVVVIVFVIVCKEKKGMSRWRLSSSIVQSNNVLLLVCFGSCLVLFCFTLFSSCKLSTTTMVQQLCYMPRLCECVYDNTKTSVRHSLFCPSCRNVWKAEQPRDQRECTGNTLALFTGCGGRHD